ncbi:hypothetical protein ACFRCI_23710 [Streptomyces sp. NPDC056638]|uniref:hypothetical protein n=1 Tax=Streptomyces sp. NPDC056638 TaxID=3345887 RepID=UPI00368917F5
MSFVGIELTGKSFAEGLARVWADDHDCRFDATKYEQDVVTFVREMLDEIDDSYLDEMLMIRLADRREGHK